jgi:hypothetical protein
MAVITKSAITKGAPSAFGLSKTELLAHSKLVGNTHFLNTANWSHISVNYRSAIGNQKKTLVFKASDVTPTADFKTSDSADDSFIIHSIVIHDNDGGSFTLFRYDLNVADFDINISGTVPTAPSAPVGLALIPNASNTSMGVTWSAVSGATYKLYRKTVDASWSEADLIASPTGTTYNDVGSLSLDTVYYYGVKAVKDGLESVLSVIVSASIVADAGGSFLYAKDFTDALDSSSEAIAGPASIVAGKLVMNTDTSFNDSYFTKSFSADVAGGVNLQTEYTFRIFVDSAVDGWLYIGFGALADGGDLSFDPTAIAAAVANGTPLVGTRVPKFNSIADTAVTVTFEPDGATNETVTISRIEIEITANAGSVAVPGLPLTVDFADAATTPAGQQLIGSIAVASGALTFSGSGATYEISDLRPFFDVDATSGVNVRLYTSVAALASTDLSIIYRTGGSSDYLGYNATDGYHAWAVQGSGTASRAIDIGFNNAFNSGDTITKIEIVTFAVPALGVFGSTPTAIPDTLIDGQTTLIATYTQDVANATSYEGLFGLDSVNLNPWFSNEPAVGGVSNPTLSGLTANTTYYMQIIAHGPGGQQVASDVFTATTEGAITLFDKDYSARTGTTLLTGETATPETSVIFNDGSIAGLHLINDSAMFAADGSLQSSFIYDFSSDTALDANTAYKVRLYDFTASDASMASVYIGGFWGVTTDAGTVDGGGMLELQITTGADVSGVTTITVAVNGNFDGTDYLNGNDIRFSRLEFVKG